MTPPTSCAPISERRCPYWNTSTITPYAAPTDSRFNTMVTSGITTERNASSSSKKARPKTKTNTSGRCCLMVWLKSTDPAVVPVT